MYDSAVALEVVRHLPAHSTVEGSSVSDRLSKATFASKALLLEQSFSYERVEIYLYNGQAENFVRFEVNMDSMVPAAASFTQRAYKRSFKSR